MPYSYRRRKRGGVSAAGGMGFCEGKVVGQKKELENPGLGCETEAGGKTTCSGTMPDVLCRKCWHLDLWTPRPPPVHPSHPLNVYTHSHSPSFSVDCPSRGQMKTDRWTQRAPTWTGNSVFFSMMFLNSTQLRAADMGQQTFTPSCRETDKRHR